MNTKVKNSEFILNWSPVKKCLLMLSMALLIHGDWLVWKLYIYFTPELWKFVNIHLLLNQLLLNLLILPALALLMLLCWLVQESKKAQIILPYVCVLAFGLSMSRDAYLSGVMCPATSMTFMLAMIVGLFLFKRVVIYSAALVTMGIFSAIMILTLRSELPYAPLFTPPIAIEPTQSSIFWTASMLWFIFPVFIGGLVLLELLLSQWRQREKNVEVLSQVDPLTTLYNRRTIYDFLEILLAKRYTDHRLHALILLDLDFFKHINDSYGHTIGDKALVETANVLKRIIRSEDIVGRFGGEEFIIVVANTTYHKTQQIAERCRNELSNLKVQGDHGEEVVVTASFGITHFDCHITSLDTVLKQADEALYHAKNLGRNQVVQYEDYIKQRDFKQTDFTPPDFKQQDDFKQNGEC